MVKVLLLGSNNVKKRRELATILEGLDLEIRTPAEAGIMDEPVEDGETFEDNAVIKATYYGDRTGLPAMADDSGLMVDALGGEPGVRSARYAGEGATDQDRCNKLLNALEKVPDHLRTARFVCTIALVRDGKVLGTSTGTCDGRILREMRGENGFGYDPVFFYPPEGKSFAELPPDLKNRVSHRGLALQGIRPVLEALSGG